jgi:hypothetical protein
MDSTPSDVQPQTTLAEEDALELQVLGLVANLLISMLQLEEFSTWRQIGAHHSRWAQSSLDLKKDVLIKICSES